MATYGLPWMDTHTGLPWMDTYLVSHGCELSGLHLSHSVFARLFAMALLANHTPEPNTGTDAANAHVFPGTCAAFSRSMPPQPPVYACPMKNKHSTKKSIFKKRTV